jgi:HNH endonuclease
MSFKQRPLLFRTLPTGCYIIANMKVNADGYFRYRFKDGLIMFHRLIWKLKKGEIPEGYEINHKCNNRGCCNIEHLECISRAEHLDKTNRMRYVAPSGKLMKYAGENRKDY